jgi:hypothetical protein
MNNPGHVSESLETIFWAKILKFFDADQGSGSRMKKFESGNQNKHPGSATLLKRYCSNVVSSSHLLSSVPLSLYSGHRNQQGEGREETFQTEQQFYITGERSGQFFGGSSTLVLM